MSVQGSHIDRDWMIKAIGGLALLVAVSPLFAIGAEAVGYIEPLEHAAELTGARTHATVIVAGLFTEYGIPGLGTAAGTLIAGAVGTVLTLAVALGVGQGLAE
ncbi:metal transporter [Halocatena halophila]|uniref:metal transporter n=1 Tax=Halocatena halophila TaxID=2814576 RepID=UPI002ED5A8D7